MAKIQRTFVGGKMNKGLDERLLPPGQYRDALNIQVSTSTGSDVGAIENIPGNVLKNGGPENENWASNFGISVSTNVVGSVVDGENDKIYYLVASQNASISLIAEYDQGNGLVDLVLVDLNSILSWNWKQPITGINILDGFLLFTDNNKEPKKINIARFKAGTSEIQTHSQVFGRAFVEADITVIKKRPQEAPSLETKATKKTSTGVGCGLDPVEVTHNFSLSGVTTGDNVPVPNGTEVDLNFSGLNDWAVDDIVILNASKPREKNLIDEYRVRAKVKTPLPTGSPYTYKLEVLSASSDMASENLVWSCLLEEDPPMFENKFPRFAYRWKYIDGEYSAFSPFSEPAFIGGDFEYKSSKAHNVGMKNNLRYLRIHTFETPPDDVTEIDILYKETNSTGIYKVDSVGDTATEYEITSEIVGPIIEPNQFLRTFDNVPRKAKSQEVVSNRIVYGNYTQGYDITNKPNITASVTSTNHPQLKRANSSVKSLRNYQVGVVFGDAYGRETPVFTSENASVTVDKQSAVKVNSISAQASGTAPAWATYFKYYIKDVSGEYYNLALDRFFPADDGNVWLSFPSAERNKLQEGDFLALKKVHDDEASVDEDIRYKALSISNETPDDVLYKKTVIAEHQVSSCNVGEGDTVITFNGPRSDFNTKFAQAFNQGGFIRLQTANGQTDLYELKEGGPTQSVPQGGSDSVNYRVVLEEALGSEIAGSNVAVSKIAVIDYIARPRRMYNGKFFVKINIDANFKDFLIDPQHQLNPVYENVAVAAGDNPIITPVNSVRTVDDTTPEIISQVAWRDHQSNAYTTPDYPEQGSNQFTLLYLPHDEALTGSNTIDNTDLDITSPDVGAEWFVNNMKVGKFIKFEQDPDQNYYKITNISTLVRARADAASPYSGRDIELVRTFTLDKNIQNNPASDWGGTISTTSVTKYDFEIFRQTTDWDTFLDEFNVEFSSSSPAIFETIPQETLDLDIYYEATDALIIDNYTNAISIDWFNCYSFGNGVESNRIRDDFNAPTLDKGSKASAPLDEPYAQEVRKTGLIYSGIFNSISGVNNLNQFNMAEKITKDLEPIYGGIQKLHARDTSLVAFCEDKIYRILIDKDAIYNADGNPNLIASNRVLGDASAFAGEYGISTNPESFASYGFRIYFADKKRSSVLRLSMDGITSISDKGMSEYIEDAFKAETNSYIWGSYDQTTGCYNLAINNETLSFQEKVNGWPTRLSYMAVAGQSLNNEYYTFNQANLYEHSAESNRNTFYGQEYNASVKVIFNDQPSSIKNFKALSYEGDTGWAAEVVTQEQDGSVSTWVKKEGIYYNFISGKAGTWDNDAQSGTLKAEAFNVQGLGYPTSVVNNDNNPSGNVDDVYTIVFPHINDSAQIKDVLFTKRPDNDIHSVGTIESINRVTNTITVKNTTGKGLGSTSTTNFLFIVKDEYKNTSGVIGYYADVEMTTSSVAKKELFAINSEVFISS